MDLVSFCVFKQVNFLRKEQLEQNIIMTDTEAVKTPLHYTIDQKRVWALD